MSQQEPPPEPEASDGGSYCSGGNGRTRNPLVAWPVHYYLLDLAASTTAAPPKDQLLERLTDISTPAEPTPCQIRAPSSRTLLPIVDVSKAHARTEPNRSLQAWRQRSPSA